MLGRAAYQTPFILAELDAYATGNRLAEKQAIAFAMADMQIWLLNRAVICIK